jgi:hypothetical protein
LPANLSADLSGVAHLSAVALAKAEAESEVLTKVDGKACLLRTKIILPCGQRQKRFVLNI